MKFDIVRANAIKNYLIRKIKITCDNPSRKCDFHLFLHELLDILLFENLSLTQKKSVFEI